MQCRVVTCRISKIISTSKDTVYRISSPANVRRIKNKAQSFASSNISQWLEKIPQGSEILPQLQKLRKIAEQRGEDAEKLARDTINEIKQVLDRKTQEAEKLAQGAAEEASK